MNGRDKCTNLKCFSINYTRKKFNGPGPEDQDWPKWKKEKHKTRQGWYSKTFLQSSYRFLANFLQNSYRLRTKFLQNSDKLLTNLYSKFLQTSNKILIAYKFHASLNKLLADFFWTFYKILMNFLHTLTIRSYEVCQTNWNLLTALSYHRSNQQHCWAFYSYGMHT